MIDLAARFGFELPQNLILKLKSLLGIVNNQQKDDSSSLGL
jgi:hypothetical protein